MAASVSGSKTCNNALSPTYTAAALTTLLAIAPENMTLNQLYQLTDAMTRIKGLCTTDTVTTVGSLLT